MADLGVHCRIPIRVIKDYSICASQIHANPAAARAQDEYEKLGIGVEALHQNLQHPHRLLSGLWG